MAGSVERIARELRAQISDVRELSDNKVLEVVRRFNEHALGGGGTLVSEADATREILAELSGFGVLQPLIDDPRIEEIWINSPTDVFIARDGVSERLALEIDQESIQSLVERMLSHSGRRVDLTNPFVDASLPDGSRLHVVIPDVTRRHWSINIRKFNPKIKSLQTLERLGMFSPEVTQLLRSAMQAGLTVVVSGPTHSGKTTMLNALLSALPENTRVITVEETFEIQKVLSDQVAMQCRPANIEGIGEVSLRRLVKESLRMRPDRIVVGEVREAEALDLLIGLNSGIPGLASIHSHSARDALMKMCTLPLLAGRNIDSSLIVPMVASCIDLVVHCARENDGARYVAEILALTGDHHDGTLGASSIYARQAGGAADLEACVRGKLPDRLAERGLRIFSWATRR